MTDRPFPPWTAGPAGPDPTIELPDPTEVTRLAADAPGPVEPSRWPPVVDLVARYAPVGTAATAARVGAWLLHYPHPELLDDLAEAYHAGDDEAGEDWYAERAHQRWVVAGRWSVALTLVAVAANRGWALLGDHALWPLVYGSAWVTVWYTAKGWVLDRRSAGHAPAGPPRPAPATAWDGPPVRPDGPEDRSAEPIEDQPEDRPARTRGFLRLVRTDRPEPGPRRTTAPVERTREPGPSPLTQDRVERALLKAVPKLAKVKPEVDGDPVVQVLGSRHMGNGWAVTVGLPEEVLGSDLVPARDRIAGAFSTLRRGVPESCVVLLPDPSNPRLAALWICDTPPLEGPPVRTALWHAEQVDVHAGIPFGSTIEGDPVLVSPLAHWLITGGTGSGKTESGGVLQLGCAFDPSVRQILMDPQGLGAWAGYRDVAEVIDGASPERLAEMADKLEWLVEVEFPRRERAIAEYLERGSLAMSRPKVTPRMAQDPTAGLEWLVVAIDEAHALYRAADPVVRRKAEEATIQIITRGRAFGVFLHLTTQKPTNDNIPTSITAIANTRLLFSVERTEMADAAMPGWRKLGMDPLALQPDDGRGGGNPGAGYLKGIGLVEPARKWVLMRCECADLNEAREILRRARAMRLRVRPDLLPGHGRPPEPAREPTVLDLAPLRRVIDVVRPAAVMAATEVVARLADRYPIEHGEVTTIDGLNAVLAPYQLRTQQFTTPDDPVRRNRLRLTTLEARLKQLSSTPKRTSEWPTASGPLQAPITPSDLQCRRVSVNASALPPIDVRLAKPQVNDPRTRGPL